MLADTVTALTVYALIAALIGLSLWCLKGDR